MSNDMKDNTAKEDNRSNKIIDVQKYREFIAGFKGRVKNEMGKDEAKCLDDICFNLSVNTKPYDANMNLETNESLVPKDMQQLASQKIYEIDEGANKIFIAKMKDQGYKMGYALLLELKWECYAVRDMSVSQRTKLVADALLNILKKEFRRFLKKKEWDDSCWKNYNFWHSYYKVLQSRFNLPTRKVLCKIALSRYENRDNNGQMCIIKDIERIKTALSAEIDPENMQKFHFSNREDIDAVRKILEISSLDKGQETSVYVALQASDPKGYCHVGFLAEKDIPKAENEEVIPRIFFQKGGWILKIEDEPVLEYKRDTYSFGQYQSIEQGLTKKLQKFEKTKLLPGISSALDDLKHGGIVIVMEEAEAETERLCKKYNRGTKLKKFSLEGKLSMLSSFCAVDGAVFIDYNGNCYGYGVVLDGEAVVKGENGRGSRYNSAKNYIAQKAGYAIVVSEDRDKGITIFDSEEIPKI